MIPMASKPMVFQYSEIMGCHWSSPVKNRLLHISIRIVFYVTTVASGNDEGNQLRGGKV